MKKLLLMASVLLFSLAGCSSSKDEPKEELQYVQLKIRYDEAPTDVRDMPRGKVALFYLDGQHVESYQPKHVNIWDNTIPPTLEDVNGEPVYPVYVGKITPEEGDDGRYINQAVTSIYWYQLSTALYGKPGKGKYLLLVSLDTRPYSYSYKVLNIEHNMTIEKTFRLNDNRHEQDW